MTAGWVITGKGQRWMRNEPETARQLAARGNAVKQAQARTRLEGVLEDLEFLMHPDLGGETNPDVIARRVGYPKKASLARYLHRHAQHERGKQFERRLP